MFPPPNLLQTKKYEFSRYLMKCFASLQLLSVDRCIIDWFKLKKKRERKETLKSYMQLCIIAEL